MSDGEPQPVFVLTLLLLVVVILSRLSMYFPWYVLHQVVAMVVLMLNGCDDARPLFGRTLAPGFWAGVHQTLEWYFVHPFIYYE